MILRTGDFYKLQIFHLVDFEKRSLTRLQTPPLSHPGPSPNVYLHPSKLSVPLKDQWEQPKGARWLSHIMSMHLFSILICGCSFPCIILSLSSFSLSFCLLTPVFVKQP